MSICVLLQTPADMMKGTVIMTMTVNLNSYVEPTIVQLPLAMTHLLTVASRARIVLLIIHAWDIMKAIVIMTMTVSLGSNVEQTIVLLSLAMKHL